MEKQNNNVFLYLGVLDSIIGISDFAIRTIKASKIVISPVTIVCIVVLIISIVLYGVVNNAYLNYEVRKFFSYWLRGKDSYTVLKKESIYIYLSRTEMEHVKKHEIVSNVRDLQSFNDKFKWSKGQALKDIVVKSDNPKHIINVSRVENWHQYTVNFEQIGKRQKENINVTISNLHDPDKEALPFLSSNVVYKTKTLKMLILFSDWKLKPKNIKYKIYDNYASDSPLFQKDLKFDEIQHKIEITEEKPINGFRYVITWDFDEDD